MYLLLHVGLLSSLQFKVIRKQISDISLCSDNYPSLCYGASRDKKCEMRGSTSSNASICESLAVTIGQISSFSDVEEIFDTLGADENVRRIELIFRHKESLLEVGQLIDRILRFRPWWECVSEPFPWDSALPMVFEKYHRLFDGHLQHLASVQYVPRPI